MVGLAWSGGGNFSNALNGRTTVASIPSASYGETPVILVAIAYHGGDSTQSPQSNHTIDLLFPDSSTLVISSPNVGSANGADGSLIVGATLATGAIDGGADVRVKTNFATPSPPEVGVAAACVVTFATTRARIYHNMTPNVSGGMPTGTINDTFSSGFFTLTTAFDAEPYAIGALGFAGIGAGAPSWASLSDWADVITRTNGTNKVQLALWTRPTPLDTSLQITNSPGATNGAYTVLATASDHPSGAPLRGFGTIVGD